MRTKTDYQTIEGRLLMADFKEHDTRCRVHPSVGNPVVCLFDNEKRKAVLESLLRFVRVSGEAKRDAVSGKILSIKIHDIEKLDNREEKYACLHTEEPPVAHDFWESPTLEELARRQNVRPINDIREIIGTWPGNTDDGFEDEIDRLRHHGGHARKSGME